MRGLVDEETGELGMGPVAFDVEMARQHGWSDEQIERAWESIEAVYLAAIENVGKSVTEAVHHPSHYGGGDNTYEAIKVIEAWDLGFNLGNTVKYVARADKKGKKVEDLKKAAWYLLRELALAEGLGPDVYTSAFNVWTKAPRSAVVNVNPTEDDLRSQPPLVVHREPGFTVVNGPGYSPSCRNCRNPSMPYGTCNFCGRKWGSCAQAAKAASDAEDLAVVERLAEKPTVIGEGTREQTAHQLRVEAMMRGYGQQVPAEPVALSDGKARELRARLILEEALETIQRGLRVDVVWKRDERACELGERLTAPGSPGQALSASEFHEVASYLDAAYTGEGEIAFDALGFRARDGEVDLVELADGCADVSVVTIGTLSAFGIKDKRLLEEVDANNLLKIERGHTDPETGKFIKPYDHPPPAIGDVLRSQSAGGEGVV